MKSPLKAGLVFIVMLLLLGSHVTGCAPNHDFNSQLKAITKPYRFGVIKWEFNAVGEEIRKVLCDRQNTFDDDNSEVSDYFSAVQQIKQLESEIEANKSGNRQGNLASLEAELGKLRQQNKAIADMVERQLETQIRDILSQQSIFNPLDKYIGSRVGFPPIIFKLGKPPHLLVVSPRDRIESIWRVTLLPAIKLEDMESIEDDVDKLGVSSLVVATGGLSTYPSFVTDRGDLRFVINAATEEWLHQYLFFKPLGFRYALDLTGICRNYEIAIINESLVGMVSREIGDIVYKSYYYQNEIDSTKPGATGAVFDFNQEMREIRRGIDGYLARGEIKQAEEFMEQKRQFLETKGYYIRKLNQAYFAFHGTYADKPTSINPIGAEMKQLRNQSTSLKEFLETVAAMTSRQDLADSVN
ncbi:hypothetical protein ACFLV0_06125 [Chloroflexota bacterium]